MPQDNPLASLNRRKLIASAGSFAAMPSFASDRDIIDLSCNNKLVPVSSVHNRLALPSDFQETGLCKVTSNSFEGPYFLCVNALSGKNLAGDLLGEPLTLAMRILDQDCNALPNTVVDVWSCGADGRYSGQNASPDVKVTSGGHKVPENDLRFGRGVLRTDADGIVEWDTVYPGFYAGRAIHIHFKVHRNGRSYVTNQAYLPEDWNQRVLSTAPYNTPRPIERVTASDEPSQMNFETYSIVERGDRLMALLNIGID